MSLINEGSEIIALSLIVFNVKIIQTKIEIQIIDWKGMRPGRAGCKPDLTMSISVLYAGVITAIFSIDTSF